MKSDRSRVALLSLSGDVLGCVNARCSPARRRDTLHALVPLRFSFLFLSLVPVTRRSHAEDCSRSKRHANVVCRSQRPFCSSPRAELIDQEIGPVQLDYSSKRQTHPGESQFTFVFIPDAPVNRTTPCLAAMDMPTHDRLRSSLNPSTRNRAILSFLNHARLSLCARPMRPS